jgi:hypothetical protein
MTAWRRKLHPSQWFKRRPNSADQETKMDAKMNQDAKFVPRKRWPQMDSREKTTFVFKICVMVCTGGFAFANVVAP